MILLQAAAADYGIGPFLPPVVFSLIIYWLFLKPLFGSKFQAEINEKGKSITNNQLYRTGKAVKNIGFLMILALVISIIAGTMFYNSKSINDLTSFYVFFGSLQLILLIAIMILFVIAGDFMMKGSFGDIKSSDK